MKGMLAGFLVCLFILCMGINSSFSGELYRWVDENGVVHFSDSLNDEATSGHKNIEPRVIQNPEKEQEEYEKQKQEVGAHNVQIRKENAEILSEYKKGVEKAGEKKVVVREGTVLSREEYQQTLQQVIERNAKIKERNARILKENERLQKEYEKKLKEIEARNAEIDARNARIRKENELAQKEYEKRLKELEEQKAQTGDSTEQTQKK